MFDITKFEKGISIEEFLPNWKKYLADLNGQRRKYEEQELEVGLGPEPTRSRNSAGETEMFQIKKMSRYPYGETVLRHMNKGINVLSVVDDLGEEAEEYRRIWKYNNMDRKLEILKRDFRIGGTAFIEMGFDFREMATLNVKTPKKVTTFSTDPVNNHWADFAIEVFENGGNDYLRYFDETFILTFLKVNDAYVLDEWEQHTLQVCPIVPIYNKITSDGVVKGNIEDLKGIFDTLRQRISSTSQAAYWSGTRTLVVKNVNLEEKRRDANGVEYSVLELIEDSIRVSDNGFIVLPGSENGNIASPELSQTEETNIIQLIEAKKDTLRDLAANTGVPYFIFDGMMTPTSQEASIQAYNAGKDDKDLDKANIGYILENILTQFVFASTGEYVELTVVWAVTEQVSQNQLADTVSKLYNAGIPPVWIAKYVMRGYHPDQIEELINLMTGQNQLAMEQTAFVKAGLA
jgi:hypothetical protein